MADIAEKYRLPEYVTKRVRFYDGQFLKDDDFAGEQHYHADRRRRHDRLLHVSGIAEGLSVVVDSGNPKRVKVSPGTALDGSGNQILLDKEAFPQPDSGLSGKVVLAVAFDEKETDEADNSGVKGYTRITQMPVFSFHSDKPAGAVLLAELTIGTDGTIMEVGTGVRQYSGLRLPGPANAAGGGALRSQGDASPGWAELGCHLSVKGALSIAEGAVARTVTLTESGTAARINAGTTAAGANQYNFVLAAGNDTGQKAVHFLNSSTRDADGGRNAYTIRNDGGPLHLGSTGFPTSVFGNAISLKTNTTVEGALTVTGGLFKTNALNRMTPLYIRGTGLNNNAPRLVIAGGTTVSSGAARGLTLVVLRKDTHEVVSTTSYDTYGDTASWNTLATALNTVSKDQIGILTSYDAWEGAFSDSLRAAFKKLGLYKAMTITGSTVRRPYAALFEASAASGVGTAKAEEVLLSNDATAPFAEIRGWLADGSFAASGAAPNALTDTQGSAPFVTVHESGHVEIGKNPLRISSAWSDSPGAGTDRAEISNDTASYKCLMIVGNRSAGDGVRRVGIWDRLEVNGTLSVKGPLDVDGHAKMGYETDIPDFGAPLKTGVYSNAGNKATTGNVPDQNHGWTHLFTARHANQANNHQLQIAASYESNDRLFFRKIAAGLGSSNPGWNELATRASNTFTGDQTIEGNITFRKNLLSFGTTRGGNAGSGEILGALGFYGYGQSHGQFSYRAGRGFELVDRSSDGPSMSYTEGQYPGANLRLGTLNATGGSITLGEWTLQADGTNLYFKRGDSIVARLATTWDRFLVFKNINGAAPYFYFNQDGSYGVHKG